jgi:hypothetical protein
VDDVAETIPIGNMLTIPRPIDQRFPKFDIAARTNRWPMHYEQNHNGEREERPNAKPVFAINPHQE